MYNQSGLLIPYGEDYKVSNNGAQRKPAPPIKSDTFVWTLGFWIPSVKSLSGVELGYTITKSEWVERLDAIISSLIDRTGAKGGPVFALLGSTYDLSAKKRTPYDPGHHDVRHERALYGFQWQGLECVVRVSLHSEYASFTFYFDIPRDSTKLVDWGGKLRRSLDSIHDIDAIAEPDSDVTNKKAAIDHIYSDLCKSFWNTNILPAIQSSKSRDSTTRSIRLDRWCGEVFADFRGVILAQETLDGSKNDSYYQLSEHEAAPRYPVEYAGQRQSFSDETLAKFAKSLTKLHAILAIADLGQNTSDDLDTKSDECACTMLDGRVVYMSSLGRQSLSSASELLPSPLNYILLVQSHFRYKEIRTTAFEWHLGRLVARLHAAGLRRLAAVHDLRLMELLAPGISALDAELRQEQYNLIRDVTSKDELGLRVRNIYDRLQGLTSGGNIVEDNSSTNRLQLIGGLDFRVNRSRYYVSQLEELWQELRIDRIEQWQPYNEFIMRRMGSSFSFINRLGTRMSELERRLDSALDRVQTGSLARSSRTTAEIQTVADLAGLFIGPFAVIHYGGEAVERISDVLAANGFKLSTTGKELLDDMSVLLGTALFIILGFNFVRRKWRGQEVMGLRCGPRRSSYLMPGYR